MAYSGQEALEGPPPHAVLAFRNGHNSLALDLTDAKVSIPLNNGTAQITNGLGCAYVNSRDARGFQACWDDDVSRPSAPAQGRQQNHQANADQRLQSHRLHVAFPLALDE